MQYSNGWVKIHRELQNNPYYFSEPFTRIQAWIDLIILANYRKSFFYVRGVKVEVDRGQLSYSMNKLAERWQWSKGKVQRYLDDLENEKQIVLQKTNVTTLISITNYDKYQDDSIADDTANGTQTGRRRDADGTQTDLYKEDKEVIKKENKEKKNIPAWDDFKSYCLTKNPKINLDGLKMKYESWIENGWKDGKDKPIKNWKSKILNTMPYMKIDENPKLDAQSEYVMNLPYMKNRL